MTRYQISRVVEFQDCRDVGDSRTGKYTRFDDSPGSTHNFVLDGSLSELGYALR